MPSAVEARQEALYRGSLQKLHLAMEELDLWAQEYDGTGVVIMQITIQGPAKLGSGWRAIIKGQTEAGELKVAFRNGDDLKGLLVGLVEQAKASGIVWREDKPYDPGAQKG